MSAEPTTAPAPAKRSNVEVIKETSRALRGTIAEELADNGDHFAEADKQLLKFHGTYQQEDRDARKSRRTEGLGKFYLFMVRCRIPGGQLTAEQYCTLDDLASTHGNGTLRVTSRQSFQFHGVVKRTLKGTIAGVNECLLSTLGACGDVNRNVMACPAPDAAGSARAQLQEDAAALALHLAPKTGAYHEIWLGGKSLAGVRDQGAGAREEGRGQKSEDRYQGGRVSGGNGTSSLTPDPWPLTPAEEPIYGKVYLPRKFKAGLALPEDNCIDVYSQDLGLLADVQDGRVVGYNVLVGGGMGMTHGKAETFPHLARPICYVQREQLLAAAEAVVTLFRDHGNRADRKRARIKYLVHDWGVEKFRVVLTEYLPFPLVLPKPLEVTGSDLHLGRHAQGDGKFYYGVSVESGRIKDERSLRLRTALRALIEHFRPAIRLTAAQDVLLCGLDREALPEVERVLQAHGVALPERVGLVRRLSLACPAIPTCGLALCESERALPGVVDQLEAALREMGLGNEPIGVRMTGCPNGCVRPYQSDVGIVGRSGDKYTLFVGGSVLGDRLNFPLKDLVPRSEIVATLMPLLRLFRADRRAGESFGDFCHRLGPDRARALIPATH